MPKILPWDLDGVLPGPLDLDGVLPGDLDGVLPEHLDGVLPGRFFPGHLDEVCPGTWMGFCPGTDLIFPRHMDGGIWNGFFNHGILPSGSLWKGIPVKNLEKCPGFCTGICPGIFPDKCPGERERGWGDTRKWV